MPKPRRFLISDAIVLTAATAFGIAGLRHIWTSPAYPWLWDPGKGWSVAVTYRRFLTATALLLPLLAACSAATLVSRLIPPRPPLRRIARQSGVAACGIVLIVLAAQTIIEAISLMTFESSRGYLGSTWMLGGFASGFTAWIHNKVILTSLEPVGFAVAATWATLWLGHAGRPEGSWVDRFGRVLGVCWLAASLAFWLNQRCFKLELPGILS